MGNFLTSYREESIWTRRGAAAFALAPLVPILIYTALFLSDVFLSALPVVATVAYLQMLILGLPLAFLLNRFGKVSLLTTALWSAIAGALPWTAFIAYSLFHGHWWGGGTTNPNNWITLLAVPCIFGGMGCVGGVAWWYIAKPRGTPTSVQA